VLGRAAFRQDGNLLSPLAGHILANGSLDEAGHQLGDKIDEDEGFDSRILFEEHRRNLQEGLEKAVAFFQTRLIFVGLKHLERRQVDVGRQGEDSIHGLGAGDAGEVALRVDLGQLPHGAAVGGVRGRSSAAVLTKTHGFVELDLHLDPVPSVVLEQTLNYVSVQFISAESVFEDSGNNL